MGKAVSSLDHLKTADALPPEMEALNYLLKAQAEVKRHEIMRQQAGNGSGNTRSNYDVSTLFDKELQKAQQTNYESKASTSEARDDANQSALDKIKELARRQDELLKKQQELARDVIEKGLIGNVLHSAWLGAHCVLLAPTTFLRNPFCWLEAVSRYRADFSGAPNRFICSR